jgi:hypothetical protein
MMRYSAPTQELFEDIVEAIFAAPDRATAEDIIEQYDSYWMEIVGTRGFKGKKAKNARTMANRHMEIVGNLGNDKPEKKPKAQPVLNDSLFGE